ncbi:MAG: IS21 family transposase [Caldilineaceae bacterium]|nr:IS21 family transposase [Caldilineaceae bacterium]
MIQVEERFMMRELHRHGVSISEIARRTGHDRKTVRKTLKTPLQAAAKPRRRKPRKIDPYVPYLEQRMAAGVFNARKLYGELRGLGYPGKETQVRSFVQAHRQPPLPVATVRFETAPGEQAQVDWAHFGSIVHQGVRRRLYAFVMTLGWSRTMYLEFTVATDISWWLRCHLHAFRYFGGAPQRMLHDNLKTAVLERRGSRIHWHPRYLDFADYYGFSPHPCRPYRAQTKGKVERGVCYVRGNFWPGLTFTDLTDLNHQALAWLNNVANVRIHGTTNEQPFARLPDEQLTAIHDKPDYDTAEITHRRSSRDCLISYRGNFYSVPAAYAGQRLQVRVTELDELTVLNADGWEIAHHRLVHDKGERCVVASHYAALLPPSLRSAPASQATQTEAPQIRPVFPGDIPHVVSRPLSEYQALLEVPA